MFHFIWGLPLSRADFLYNNGLTMGFVWVGAYPLNIIKFISKVIMGEGGGVQKRNNENRCAQNSHNNPIWVNSSVAKKKVPNICRFGKCGNDVKCIA